MIFADPRPRKPIKDRNYLKFLSEKKCLYCGEPAVSPHHIRVGHGDGQGSMGRRPDDYRCIPSCFKCHRALHGTDKGRLKWMTERVGREEVLESQVNNLIEFFKGGTL